MQNREYVVWSRQNTFIFQANLAQNPHIDIYDIYGV